MPIYQLQGDKLSQINESKIDLEKDIQKITEENLFTLFGLEFIASEFTIHDFRIDTIAYDPESKSFVIIEYKRDKSSSVIDQGFSYLSLMLKNKSDFVLEYYHKKSKKEIDKKEFDWSQSRVIFIANSFTTYQENAVGFRDLPIELWEVKKYDNNTILYNQIITAASNDSLKAIPKNSAISKIANEVKKHTEESLIPKGTEGENLYNLLKEKIQLIDPNLYVHPTKLYLTFRLPGNWRNIISVWIKKEKLLLELLRSEPRDFQDPEKKIRYREDSFKHFNQHISLMDIESEKEVDYAAFVIKQLYDRFIKDYTK